MDTNFDGYFRKVTIRCEKSLLTVNWLVITSLNFMQGLVFVSGSYRITSYSFGRFNRTCRNFIHIVTKNVNLDFLFYLFIFLRIAMIAIINKLYLRLWITKTFTDLRSRSRPSLTRIKLWLDPTLCGNMTPNYV